ncbi:uncharacterized protein CANTADRAFT_25799 [Suhomyces tanzawaensis NRRL Y-17324]|uniref:Uncharacterized protein n=1 Tax=Suhomyces tanzawaensis NRRL Y-17324 TaxID=984487 RepID=A0A1E4SKV4_9ASCO|nr:uncharacterized protein CANTADRAFT_25799 [Suhomyces tanzawaensis NRRL Y-17324]ODV80062.1 hypothetical protein CANTADRAFT_25799 [Suhomyces tanzawaensis NRRL Y-17324]
MAQGKLKLKPSSGPGRAAKKAHASKKAAPRIIKPKRTQAKDALKLTKIHQGQLMSSTEKLIASRVGHLEIIKGSRRQVEKAAKEQAKKK